MTERVLLALVGGVAIGVGAAILWDAGRIALAVIAPGCAAGVLFVVCAWED